MAYIKCEGGIWMVNHDKKIIISPPCGLKSCPKCAKRMKKIIVLRILQMMDDRKESHHFWFWTLTPHSSAIWGEWSEKNMSKAWAKLRKRINRRLKNQIFWVVTKEYTKGEGEFTDAPPFIHYHLIIGYHTSNKPILTEELKKMATQCGMGYMALVGTKETKDVHITSIKFAWYIAKYASKHYTAYRMRRAIIWSQNVRELGELPPKSDGWVFLNMSDIGVKRYSKLLKYKVTAMDDITGNGD